MTTSPIFSCVGLYSALTDTAIKLSERDCRQRIARRVYDSTVYGVRLVHPANRCGIELTCVVEGTNIEIPAVRLTFPFTLAAFWEAVGQVDQAAKDAEALWDSQGTPAADLAHL